MKAGIRSSLFAVLGIATLALGACDNGGDDSQAVVAPVFTPDGGSHTASVQVSLSTTTLGASIRYTIDDSDPSATAGIAYAGPFTLTTTTTVKAIAYSGMDSSAIVERTFTITAPVVSTVTVNDFEADTAGATYPIINTDPDLNATVKAIADTITGADGAIGATTGNASTQVLEVNSVDYNQYVKVPLTLPTGTSLSDYGYVYVRAVFPANNGDNGYKNVLAFIAETITDGYHAASEAVGQSTSTGDPGTAWKEFFIPIDAAKAAEVDGTSLEIALGISRAAGTGTGGPYYLDEIKLYPKPVALRTFETDAVGATYPIINTDPDLNATVKAIADTITGADGAIGATAGNASTQVLEINSNNYGQYVKLPLTLPDGMSLSDYGFVTVRAVFPNNNGDNAYKNIHTWIGATIPDAPSGDDMMGQSIGTGGASTNWGVFMIPIDATKAEAVTETSLELAIGISRSAGTGTGGPYYFDDIGLITK